MPEAATVLDRFIEVTGGRAAREKIRNRVSKGHHEFVEMGLKGTQVDYTARPNKHYAVLELEALGKVEQGTDGEVAWYLSPMTGAIIEEGEARTAALRGAAFDGMLGWRMAYDEVETVGVETVNGKPCYKVMLTPEVGPPEARCYDTESGLLVKVAKTRISTQMPPMPVEVTFGDYKWVDGLLLAHKRTQVSEQCGAKREIVFVTESIEHNVELPADRFTPPAEVLAAVKNSSPSEDSTQVRRMPCATGEESASQASKKPAKPKPCGGSP